MKIYCIPIFLVFCAVSNSFAQTPAAYDTTTVLHLDGVAQQTEMKDLGKYKNLRKLYLTHCNDVTDYGFLAQLTQLEILEMPHAAIADLCALKKLKHLRRLDIRNTRIKDLAPLRGLPNLAMVLCMDTAIPRQKIAAMTRRFTAKDVRIVRDYLQ